jgi:hypothetical protein
MNNFRIKRFNDIDPPLTKNLGQKSENPVCRELRRLTGEIYYYSENGTECDFVVCSKNRPRLLIQACRELHYENREKGQKGLLDAMDFFGMKRGMDRYLGSNGQNSGRGGHKDRMVSGILENIVFLELIRFFPHNYQPPSAF